MENEILTKWQKAKKKYTIFKIKKEICKLEYKIEKPDKENRRLRIVKNLKIWNRITKTIMPYFLATGLCFTGGASINWTPFKKDQISRKLNIKTECDSLGNVNQEKQYEKFENDDDTVVYYSKWFAENNTYVRNAKKYYLTSEIKERNINLLDAENDFKNILGEPYSEFIEVKNNITMDEMNSSEIVKVILYSYDNDEFIVIEESSFRNICLTIAWLIAVSGVNSCIFFINSASSKHSNLIYSISMIEQEYSKIDVALLKKKLEIKKDNYNRLMG